MLSVRFTRAFWRSMPVVWAPEAVVPSVVDLVTTTGWGSGMVVVLWGFQGLGWGF